MPHPPGKRIGTYEIVSLLGSGGMGEVYLVEDLKLHRRLALKLISPQLTRDESKRQRFLQEARLAASIDHPHIAAVHDIGELDGLTFIAMEYVDGQSLRDLLRSGPLKLKRALDLAIQAGDALAKVHERGVVHRDLKPENLLIANDGYVKIIDFGVAKLADPLASATAARAATVTDDRVRTADGVVLGTTVYMSPEQLRGDSVDARSDVFSFAAVVHEMISGSAPFRKRTSAETISAILNETPQPPRVDEGAIGGEMQRILRKCLHKEAGARYQGMRDLVVDLRALRESLTSGETAARPAAAPPAPFLTPMRAAIAVITLAIALLAGWYATRNGTRETVTVATSSATRPTLAVLAFEVLSGGNDVAWLAKGLPSMLVTGLAQTPDVEVVGNQRLGDAARELGAESIDTLDRARLTDVAKKAGARFVLVGTIVQAGADLRIDARVEDLSSGSVVLAQSVRGPDALTLVDDLSARVRDGLGIHAKPAAVKKIAEVGSPSTEAFRLYAAGLEALENTRNVEARTLFDSALKLDPEFALAKFSLAVVAGIQGRVSESRTLMRAAAALPHRLSERDSLMVRASFAADQGRLDEATQLVESVVQQYPETVGAWISLSFMRPGNVVYQLQTLSRAIRAVPYSPAITNLYAYSLMLMGRVEEAIAGFEEYVKLRPNEGNAFDGLAEAQLVRGDLSLALSSYDRALKLGYTTTGRGFTLAMMGRYDEAIAELKNPSPSRRTTLSRMGQYADVGRELAGLEQTANSNGNDELVGALSLLKAAYSLERSDYSSARTHVASAEQAFNKMPPAWSRRWLVIADLLAGTCDARTGSPTTARTRLAHAESLALPDSPAEKWWTGALAGEIALAEGHHAEAAQRFMEAEPPRKMAFLRGGNPIEPIYYFAANQLTLRDGRARAAAAQGNLTEAIALYRDLLTPGPKNKWTTMPDPLHALALARLLDKAGRRDAARVEYQRFLGWWKTADRDLPQLAEARARIK